MKKQFSITRKILLFWGVSVLMAVTFVGGVFLISLNAYHNNIATQNMVNGHRATIEFLRQREEHLQQIGKEFVKRTNVVSTMNLLSKYQDPENYESLVYDNEKKKLSRALNALTGISNNYYMAVLDAKQRLSVFHTHATNPMGISRSSGFLSYDKGAPILMTRAGLEHRFRTNDTLPEKISLVSDSLETGRFTFATDEGPLIVVRIPIVRVRRTGKLEHLGILILADVVDSSVLTSLSHQTGLQIQAVVPDTIRPENSDWLIDLMPRLNNVPDLLGGADQHETWQNEKGFFGLSELPIENGPPIRFLFSVSSADLMTGISAFRDSAIWGGLLFLIIMTPIGLVFIHKVISSPLLLLMNGVNSISKGRYGKAIELSSSDEFGVLAQAFGRMSHIIKEREDELEETVRERTSELAAQKFALDEHAIVSIADIEGNITYVNEKFCEISGYSNEELLGHNHRILKSEEHPPEFYKNLWKTISKGEVWNGNIKNDKKEGGSYWVRATIVPFLDEQGKPFQYIAIRTDITNRVKAEEQAEKANRAKSQFLANMSHELRTPLNAIIGFSDMIKSAILGPVQPTQYADYANDINKSGKHLLGLINDILDVSKIEAGEFEAYLENLILQEIIDDAFLMVEIRAQAKQITIQNRVPEDIPVAKADKQLSKQILLNLLTNAIKFTPKGGDVSVKASIQDYTIAISVTDTGVGMSKNDLIRAAEPFVQVEREKGLHHEGTGLGLPLCKSFAELQGGRFTLESEQGKGTTATFTVPISDSPVVTSPTIPEKKKSEYVTWLPSMSVGLDVWDGDHKTLLSNIKLLKDTVEKNGPDKTITAILADLDAYISIHLESEEALMQQMNYPRYAEHKAQHDEFRVWMEASLDTRKNTPDVWDGVKAAGFLVDWWYGHILTADMSYKEFFQDQKGECLSILEKSRGHP